MEGDRATAGTEEGYEVVTYDQLIAAFVAVGARWLGIAFLVGMLLGGGLVWVVS